jgi:hypothetical protein
VDAQPNYVMEQPVPPRGIPFRPTMDRTAYDAAKAQANSYAPGTVKRSQRPSLPWQLPHKANQFNGHARPKVSARLTHWRSSTLILSK